jgi:ribonucleoside-diphosphate reductase alpha chain
MYMYAWKQGVKTTYYLRSRAKTAIQKTTVSAPQNNTLAAPPQLTEAEQEAVIACSLENPESCEACQ